MVYVAATLLAAVLVGLLLGRAREHGNVLVEGNPGEHFPAPASRPARGFGGANGDTTGKLAIDGTVAIPPKHRIPSVEKAHVAGSFSEWIKFFSPPDQTKIRAFADRYYGVFEIDSPQQVVWMAQAGYPMPEDLVAAEKMSDQELDQLAKEGNAKAEMLLHDRQLDRALDKLKGLDPNSADAAAVRQEARLDSMFLLNADTPFKGYVEAADALVLEPEPERRKAAIISGLIRAATLGDSRAMAVLSDYSDAGVIGPDDYIIAGRIYVEASQERTRLSASGNCGPVAVIPLPSN